MRNGSSGNDAAAPFELMDGVLWEVKCQRRVSVLRNPILANVFNRLGIVETFGTGVLRIKETYVGKAMQPEFEAEDNSIKVVLPILKDDLNLTGDERSVYSILSKTKAMPISEIMGSDQVRFGKSKATEIMKKLSEKKLVAVEGKGRGTRYIKTNN